MKYGNHQRWTKMTLPSKKKKRTTKPPKGYDSWFEYDLHTKQLKGCKCHTEKVSYVQERTYHPDFIYHLQDAGKGSFKIYIEAKGRFRDRGEARKYVDIRAGLSKNEELVFVFYNPRTPMPGARKRQDGTKLTHGDWAEKHGFRYFTEDTIPRTWGIR